MTDSVAWIDPARLHRNTHKPPVVVTSVTANDAKFDMPVGLALSPGTSQLQIDYTALSLSIPERIRFRYKLSGVDDTWVEAAGRRQAFFTNLQPGDYRFQVIAANNDGVWNEEGATLTFSIAPTFLQSIWFKGLIAFAIAALAWLAYIALLRQQAVRLQSRFDIRLAERERIARELHDTLLQGFQALMLRFQRVANRIPAEGELRLLLDDALNQAEGVLVEGRKRVRDLRAADVQGDLAKTIVDAAQKAIDADGPHFVMTVEGVPQALHALVGEEVLRIAEEAVRNAMTHANAKTIDAILSYGRTELRLIVRDDGVGMSEAILTDGKAGHFGLIGMRERADRLGGRLAVTSREGAGTEVVLSIPGRASYSAPSGALFRWLRSVRMRRSA
jgi:signal transduction histidine kinase